MKIFFREFEHFRGICSSAVEGYLYIGEGCIYLHICFCSSAEICDSGKCPLTAESFADLNIHSVLALKFAIL